MLIINNKTELRNLVEQVQYLTDYHQVNQGIAQWGIKVVDQIEDPSQLPNESTYQGDFGDAYAVGTAAPFDFYIWTRKSTSSTTYETGYWFPFGKISIVGPQGAKGDKGEKGDAGESTKWYVDFKEPSEDPKYVEGDMYLQSSNGKVYRFSSTGAWRYQANITGPQGVSGSRGPQGPQGPQGVKGDKGDTGDVGGFINIWGVLDNTNQLPTPASLKNLTVAYLVGENKDLYIQVGETSEVALWNNVGPFNAATLVTVNGVGQNVWDADTKVNADKVATATELGLVKMMPSSEASIVLNSSNQLAINPASKVEIEAEQPSSQTVITAENIQFAVKRGLVNPVGGIEGVGWTDADKATACETIGAIKKPTTTDLAVSAYGITEYMKDANGNITSRIQYVSGPSNRISNRIPTYGSNGQLLVYTDENSPDDAAVNKQYAETHFIDKLYKHNIFMPEFYTPASGEPLAIAFSIYSSKTRTELGFPATDADTITGAQFKTFLLTYFRNYEGISCPVNDLNGLPLFLYSVGEGPVVLYYQTYEAQSGGSPTKVTYTITTLDEARTDYKVKINTVEI